MMQPEPDRRQGGMQALLGRIRLYGLAAAFAAAPFGIDSGGGIRLSVPVALADDDDGGGGGGRGGQGAGDRGSRGGERLSRTSRPRVISREIFRPRAQRSQRRTPRPAAVAPLPAAPPEIVASGLTAADVSGLLAGGYRELRRAELADGTLVLRLALPPNTDAATALADIRRIAPWANADLNHFYRHAAEPCTAAICANWGQIGWSITPQAACRGEGIRIGVVDTAINADHSVLEGADLSVMRLAATEDPPASARHGTAVVALLVGQSGSRVPGLLPEATLRVADPFTREPGGGARADAFSLVLAIDHLLALDVHAINLSLAGPGNAVLAETVRRASREGTPLIAAVGNGGPASEVLYPAGYPSVIAVTAIDRSNRLYRRAVRGPHVDLAAPGVDIATAASIRGVRPQSGTSYAAPFATAAMAELRQALPDEPLDGLAARLAASAVDLGDAGHDAMFGWGLVQRAARCSGEEKILSAGE